MSNKNNTKHYNKQKVFSYFLTVYFLYFSFERHV